MRQLSQFSALVSIKYINATLLINSILIESPSLWTLIQLAIYIIGWKLGGDFFRE